MVKTKHIRTIANGKIHNMGGTTIAAEVSEKGYVTRYAVAMCHMNDNFSKRLGTVKATGRLKSDTHSVVPDYLILWEDLQHELGL